MECENTRTTAGRAHGLIFAVRNAVGWALAKYVFNFEWSFSPVVWLIGLVLGAGCAIVGGWVGLRNVLKQPPLQTLREA